jgi:hypothetical protein
MEAGIPHSPGRQFPRRPPNRVDAPLTGSQLRNRISAMTPTIVRLTLLAVLATASVEAQATGAPAPFVVPNTVHVAEDVVYREGPTGPLHSDIYAPLDTTSAHPGVHPVRGGATSTGGRWSARGNLRRRQRRPRLLHPPTVARAHAGPDVRLSQCGTQGFRAVDHLWFTACKCADNCRVFHDAALIGGPRWPPQRRRLPHARP